MNQIERIQRQTAGEPSPPVRVQLNFRTSTSSSDVLDKIRQVMSLVAAAQASVWPGDDDWMRRLPEWFIRSFEGHELQDLLSNSALWDFGSWLDSMSNPGWEWWSSESAIRSGTIRCTAHSSPFSIDPLIYLIRVSGGFELTLREG